MIISVVVPVYNVEAYLGKCINSIIKQSYKELDIILINDGSTDNSGEICENYKKIDSRISVINKENGGQSDARNVGIKNAKGEFITFIDSDDYITTNYISSLFGLLKQYNADISIVSYYYVTSKRKIDNSTGEVSVMDSKIAIRRMLLDDGFDMGPWAKMYRTDYFKKINFPVGKFFEDSLTTYQIFAEADRIVLGSEPLYYYVNRADSTVNEIFNEKKLDLIEMNKSMEVFINNQYPDLSSEAHRRVVWAYFSTLNQVLSSDDDKIIELYAPELVENIFEEENFIRNNNFLPKRDKIAFAILRIFGLKAYKIAWNIYLKVKK